MKTKIDKSTTTALAARVLFSGELSDGKAGVLRELAAELNAEARTEIPPSTKVAAAAELLRVAATLVEGGISVRASELLRKEVHKLAGGV